MKLFLGIDGGQSSTTALIGDETGKVLGEGRAGPCNHVGEAERRAKFLRAVGESVRTSAAAAGLQTDLDKQVEFESVCAGFSGGAADKEGFTRELIRARRYHITNDAEIALTGATGGEPGIIVIAGTGSIALGRNAAGTKARAGGWGYVFGDEGSAFNLVRQAIRAALRQEEGWGPPTQLYAELLGATQCPDANTLLHRCYTEEWPRERVAALAPVVDRVAQEGDRVAAALLEQAAQELAMLAAAVRRQLFAENDPVHLHYVGGVFSSTMLLQRFQLLVELDGQVHAAPPLSSPAHGALREALRRG